MTVRAQYPGQNHLLKIILKYIYDSTRRNSISQKLPTAKSILKGKICNTPRVFVVREDDISHLKKILTQSLYLSVMYFIVLPYKTAYTRFSQQYRNLSGISFRFIKRMESDIEQSVKKLLDRITIIKI